jgi:toxin ParE1/3/4
MKYSILRTDKFNDQLTDVVIYINNNFSNKEALDFLDFLGNELNNLSSFPYLGVVPRYLPIARQGYRALVIKQNIIFYKVNEKKHEIILDIIVSAKQNYLNLI